MSGDVLDNFARDSYNVTLVNGYEEASSAIDRFINIAILLNDEEQMRQVGEAVKVPLQDIVEATMILDKSIVPEPKIIEELPIVELDASYLEIDREESKVRMICSFEPGDIQTLTDWISFPPGGDVTLVVAQLFRDVADLIERKWNLSQLEQNEGPETTL